MSADTYNHGCRECAAEVGVVGAERAGLCGDHAAALLARLTAAEANLAKAEGAFEEAATVHCAMGCGDDWVNYQTLRERPS